jgi:hypothetical protein
VRALTLAVLKVLGRDQVDTGACPLLGECVCVIHVHVDGSAAHSLKIDAWSREMDRQLIAMSERIPLVMVRGTEAQLLVVRDRPRYVRDHEDRLDTDDATHTEIIRVVACLSLPRSSDLAALHQEFAIAVGLVVREVALVVLVDVGADELKLA